MDISKLNRLGRGEYLEDTNRQVELPKEKAHPIGKIKKRTTRYEPALLVLIPDNIWLFLPSRLLEPVLVAPGAQKQKSSLYPSKIIY